MRKHLLAFFLVFFTLIGFANGSLGNEKSALRTHLNLQGSLKFNSAGMQNWKSISSQSFVSHQLSNLNFGWYAMDQISEEKGTNSYQLLNVGFENTLNDPNGCLSAIYGKYPDANFTPSCNGVLQNICFDGFFGEYSTVNLTAGNSYTFKTNLSSAYITIANNAGNTMLAQGYGSVTYYSATTQSVRFFTHFDGQCTTSSESYVERFVQCGTPIVISAPDFPCYSGDGLASNFFYYAAPISGTDETADDFDVDSGTIFNLQQIRVNLFSYSQNLNYFFTINFYTNDNNYPGYLLSLNTMYPSSYRLIGTKFGGYFYEVTFNFYSPISFTQGKYFYSVNSSQSNDFWELTDIGNTGVFARGTISGEWGFYNNTQTVGFVAGECEIVEVPEGDGCLDAIYDYYPYSTYTPNCIGNFESITYNEGWYGEYSRVNVEAGTSYTFSASSSTAFITLSNGEGTTVYGTGTGSVTWTAEATEMIRFYTHLNEQCESSNDFVDRLVKCGTTAPPPSNDSCENAIAVACGDSVSGTTLTATNSGGFSSPDVFYKYTGSGSPKNVTVSLCGSFFDTVLRVYSDCSLSNQIIANDDYCNGQSQVTFASDGTSTYYIMVEGYESGSGNYVMNISCQGPVEFDAPDYACYQGDGSITSLENGYGIIETDIYRVAEDFVVDAATEFTLRQVTMSLFSTTSITGAKVRIHQDNSGLPGDIIETVDVTPSESYVYGENYGFDAHRVEFALATPIVLTEGTYWLDVTTPNNSYWIVTQSGTDGSVIAFSNNTGTSWSLDTEGYRAIFYVEGDCNAIQDLGCLDAPNGAYPTSAYTPSCTGLNQSITEGAWGYFGEYSRVNVTAGIEYTFSTDVTTAFITISNNAGTEVLTYGTGSVSWTPTTSQTVRFYTHLDEDCNYSSAWVDRLVSCGEYVAPPSNDDCANAIAVTCGESVFGTTTYASNSGGNQSPDVFYKFTGNGNAQVVTVSLCGSSYDTFVRVFSDCSLTNQISYNDDSCGEQSKVMFSSDGTSTYYIMIEGYDNNSGNFEMNIDCIDPIDFNLPDYACYQGDGSIRTIEDGNIIYEDYNYRIADDFVVDAGTEFTLRQVTMNILSFSEISGAKFRIHQDNSGLPGNIIETVDVTPTTINIFDVFFGFAAYRVEFNLTTPIVLPEGTYWLEVTTPESSYWCTTSSGTDGSAYASSNDYGNTWALNSFGDRTIFYVAGDCEEVQNPGCLDPGYGQYPATTYTPACVGENIAIGQTYYGTYSKVNVTAGTEYVFSSTNATDFITISDENGTTVIEAGFQSITWTPSFTGVVRFYTHLDDDCSFNGGSVNRFIKCGEPITIEAPDFPCYQGDGLSSNSFETGYRVNTDFYLADDFTVDAGKVFHVQQVRMNVFSNGDIINSTLNFLADNNGSPGTIVETVNMSPTSSRIISSQFGYSIHEITFDLPTTLDFTEGKYWLHPTLQNNTNGIVYWEITSTGTDGLLSFVSNDGGVSWTSYSNYRAVFFVSGECEDEVIPQDPGCLDAPYGAYPSSAYTPSCTGLNQSITEGAWGYFGEYSRVNVTAGTEYTFSTDVTTAFITISNNAGTEVLT